LEASVYVPGIALNVADVGNVVSIKILGIEAGDSISRVRVIGEQ
jgi:hypothetical protein